MTRAKTVTKLMLDRWAQILGISPYHFSGAVVDGYWEYDHVCNDVWAQYSWQQPEIASREHVADLIATATTDIENYLGFPLAPTYFHKELVTLPVVNRSRRWSPIIETKWDKIISFGQSTKTLLLEMVELEFWDVDEDGFVETATINLASEEVTNKNELRFYAPGHNADEAYRIHPKEITFSEGVYTIVFDRWVLINPQLWEKSPAKFKEESPIDGSNEDNYLSIIDIYRERVDTTLPQAKIIWSQGDPYRRYTCVCGGLGCAVCGVTTQDACVSILDREKGVVSIYPATYDTDTSSYIQAQPTIYANPTSVELYYTAGDVDQNYLMGVSLDPLSLYWAETITWMSAARLRFPICSCSGIKESVDDLMRNLVEVDKSRQIYVSIIAPDMLTNPFGTRYGESKAWDRVARIYPDGRMGGGVI